MNMCECVNVAYKRRRFVVVKKNDAEIEGSETVSVLALLDSCQFWCYKSLRCNTHFISQREIN